MGREGEGGRAYRQNTAKLKPVIGSLVQIVGGDLVQRLFQTRFKLGEGEERGGHRGKKASLEDVETNLSSGISANVVVSVTSNNTSSTIYEIGAFVVTRIAKLGNRYLDESREAKSVRMRGR